MLPWRGKRSLWKKYCLGIEVAKVGFKKRSETILHAE